MTQLFTPGLEVGVSLGPDGAPRAVEGVLNGRLEPVARWIAEVDWWVRPVAREYWKVVVTHPTKSADFAGNPGVGEQLLCEVFHDLIVDAWFLERVFD